jgi:hypothetical protein
VTGAPDSRRADADTVGPVSDAPTDAAPILAADGFTGPLDVLLDSARLEDRSCQTLDRGADRGVCARHGAGPGRADARAARPLGALDGDGRHTDRTLVTAEAAVRRPAAIAAEAEALPRHLLTRAAMGDRARERGVAADWLEQRAQLGQDAFRRGLPESASPNAAATSPRCCGPAWWRCTCRTNTWPSPGSRRPGYGPPATLCGASLRCCPAAAP